MKRTPVVELVGAGGGYGTRRVLSDVSLTVGAGELVGVVGPSGCGKTTLLRLLTDQADHHEGTVRLFGTDSRGARRARRVGYVPQLEHIDWDFPLTVRQVVLLGLAGGTGLPWYSRTERRTADALLDRLDLTGLGGRHIAELSGGQQQRMFLARSMIRGSELILLDEPTSGVDLGTRRDVLGLLANLADDGLTILLTTHDLNWVAAQLPRVVCLNGSVIADGTPNAVFTPAVLGRTYGTEVDVIRERGRILVSDPAPTPHIPTAGAQQ